MMIKPTQAIQFVVSALWRSLFRYFKLTFLLSFLITLSWCIPIGVQSKSNSFYGLGLPRNDYRGISRCGNPNNLVAVDLLAPDDGARTLAERPTFYWYIEHKSAFNKDIENAAKHKGFFKVNFLLRDSVGREAKPIFRFSSEDHAINRSGTLYKFTLPSHESNLNINQTYTWQIRYLQYETQNPESSSQIDVRAFVQREDNPLVMEQIKLVSKNLDRARIYANNAYWYDALDEYTNWIDEHPNDTKALNERQKMLDEIIDHNPKNKCASKFEAIGNGTNFRKVSPLNMKPER
jgi:hypothetical protein